MDKVILFREMGLGPVWALRRPASTPVEIELAAVAASPSVPASTGIAVSAPDGCTRELDWPELRDSVAACRACELCQARTQAVLGVGDVHADWLFVGEAPGAEEDARGEPFVGQAGKLLDNMLASIGLRRGEDVYIANAVKCRPPGNRTPQPEEIGTCLPFLVRQIELIQPKLIVALGKPATQALLSADTSIAAARGRMHFYQGIPVIVTYHPAYLLRNLLDKAKAWEDLVFMRRTMRELKAKAAL